MAKNDKVSDDPSPLIGTGNEDSLNALVRAIRYADEFVLLFAICNSNPLRQALIRQLRERLAGRMVEEMNLDGSEDNLYTLLQRRLSSGSGPRPDTLLVYGLETWLPSGTEAENSKFIKNLNITRNHFAGLFSGAMVLWLSDHHLESIAHGAPDFCSVRSGIYLFSAGPKDHVEGELLVQSLGLEGVAGLSSQDRQRRIHEIEGMLEEYGRLPESQRDPRRERRLLAAASEIYYTLANFDKTEPALLRILEIDEASFGKDHPNVATDLNNLAQLYRATNRLVEAEPLMKRALAIDECSFGKKHPHIARDLNNLSELYYATNRLRMAEPLMERVLAINEATFGKNHPDVATTLNNLAALYKATNRFAEAEPLMERAMAIDETIFGQDHPSVAIDLNNLAQLYKATNRLAEAEALMKRVEAIYEKAFGKDHPNIAVALNNLALLYQDTNRRAEAEPLMKRALEIDEHSFGKEHPKVAIRMNNLAMLYQATNRLAEAEPLMKRQLEILLKYTRQTGYPHLHLKDAIENYGGLLEQMGMSREDINTRLKDMAPEMFEGRE